MTIEIQTWSGDRRPELARLFGRAFAQDAAMVSLVNANDENAVERLTQWFDLTLQHWQRPQILVAVKDGEFVGGNIVSLGNKPPHWRFLLRWFLQQCFAFGPKVPLHVMQHEQLRLRQYSAHADLVIEFVAVDEKARGQGLARQLFDAAYNRVGRPAAVALETANPRNVVIYHHMGYQVVARYEDDGVEYVVMTKSLNEEE